MTPFIFIFQFIALGCLWWTIMNARWEISLLQMENDTLKQRMATLAICSDNHIDMLDEIKEKVERVLGEN